MCPDFYVYLHIINHFSMVSTRGTLLGQDFSNTSSLTLSYTDQSLYLYKDIRAFERERISMEAIIL